KQLNTWVSFQSAEQPLLGQFSVSGNTVARFPDGSWSTGGSPDDPDYALCEVFRIEADSRDEAKKKAQRIRANQRRKAGGGE
ncbi:hypothetical protein OD771_29515, partial [Pseudomonas aeruginosa]|uniref:hypothetical protein n=1 Tax=Pseudomonas aeruginosa TaxID=287 RepID=UPI0021F1BD8F